MEQLSKIFDCSEEQLAIQSAAADFAKSLKDGVIERDKNMIVPLDQIRQMQELGFMGMMVSPKYHGSGIDTYSYSLVMQEISKIDNSCSVAMSVNNSLVCALLERYGNEYIKDLYLKKLATGPELGCFCLTEPDAGSDPAAIITTADRKGERYILNGTKCWITNGSIADVHIVFAQTNRDLANKGIEVFVVEKSWKGVSISAKENKLGIRSSDTVTIEYHNVEIPFQNRIGLEGEGFGIAMNTLAGGRIGIASQALGIAKGAFDIAKQYAGQRHTFGVPIYKHQGIGFKLANMITEIEASTKLVQYACALKDQGLPYHIEAAQAKWFCSNVAMKTTIEAIQVLGGLGYVKEMHIERLMRDAKITQIYEGTSEIQQIIISKEILKNGISYPKIF